MTRKRVSARQMHDLRDSIELGLQEVTDREMKLWLGEVRRAVLRSINSGHTALLAAGSDDMPTLGELAGSWTTHVDDNIIMAVRAALIRAWSRFTDHRIIDSTAMDATNMYIAQVRDRLVQGVHFGVPVYEESFNLIRESLAQSAAEGWTRKELAQRIATNLDWETDGPYWREVLAVTDKRMDDLLDALGQPGNPVREHARLNDPRIKELRTQRNAAIKVLDREHSVWKTRADLIARTESTGAANYGAQLALTEEGVATKVWMATNDSRTRESHAVANDQEAPVDGQFLVGGSLMRFPGDPQAPVGEVANCRCTMVGGEYMP